jgi:RNA polymerase sigma-70 factor (ECF subfamily)
MLGDQVTDTPRLQPVIARSSFDVLVEDRLDACYRLAAVILGDRTEAEDATHEAILRAQLRWRTVRDPKSAAAWLDRIVVNECRDRLRRRRRGSEAVASIQAVPFEPAAFSPAALTAEREALAAALRQLHADHRVVVVLRYFLDLPLESIAERTGAPVGTVKSRLHYAIATLRAAYDAAARMEVDR